MTCISIIMPVYNVRSYLSETIDSIIAQSFKNWELILIDDGSSDGSSEICDRYVAFDSRIQCYHLKNSGVSAARNFGLDKAKGRYIVFADSDDLCHSLYLEKMKSYIEGTKFDVIASNPIIVSENESVPQGRVVDETVKEYKRDINISEIPEPFFHVVWGKIYDSDLIKSNKIRFDERLNRGEDTLFSYIIALNADSIGQLQSQFVSYRQRSGSLTQLNRKDNDLLKQSIHKYQCLKKELCNNSFDLQLQKRVLQNSSLGVFMEFLLCSDSFEEYEKNLKLVDFKIFRYLEKRNLTIRHYISKLVIIYLSKYIKIQSYKFIRWINFSK